MKNKLCFFILTSLLAISCGKNSEETAEKDTVRPVKAYVIQDLKETVSRTYPGVSSPVNSATITFEVPGKITMIAAEVGKKVKKGDLLARLDDRDFKNTLSKALSEKTRSQAHYNRIKNAAAGGAVSQQDLTNALAAYEAAKASYEIARKALDDTSIYAPFDGEIVARYVERHENVSPKQPIVRIIDNSKMEMTVNLPERIRLAVDEISEVWVELDAFKNKKIPAIIYKIGSEPSKTTGTYPVTVRYEQSDDIKLIPGMVGKVGGFARLKEKDYFVSVPPLSLLKEKDKTYVFKILSDKTLKKQEVTLFNRFPMNADGVPVKGLRKGEIIVAAGANAVHEGMKVKMLDNNYEPMEFEREKGDK